VQCTKGATAQRMEGIQSPVRAHGPTTAAPLPVKPQARRSVYTRLPSATCAMQCMQCSTNCSATPRPGRLCTRRFVVCHDGHESAHSPPPKHGPVAAGRLGADVRQQHGRPATGRPRCRTDATAAANSNRRSSQCVCASAATQSPRCSCPPALAKVNLRSRAGRAYELLHNAPVRLQRTNRRDVATPVPGQVRPHGRCNRLTNNRTVSTQGSHIKLAKSQSVPDNGMPRSCQVPQQCPCK
jgi:hypothetical protein